MVHGSSRYSRGFDEETTDFLLGQSSKVEPCPDSEVTIECGIDHVDSADRAATHTHIRFTIRRVGNARMNNQLDCQMFSPTRTKYSMLTD